MPTPSGTIGLSDVNAELGFSPTALISMNDAAVRTLAGVPTGTISMQNLQNKSNRVSIPLTISGNTYNYNVYNSRGPTYNPGKSDITVTINPGVLVGSTSTGTDAFSIPAQFSPADTITVVNNGVIQGRGGNGGAGANAAPGGSNPGSPGNSGGRALLVSRPVTITNNGTIAGGGGGGGGGASNGVALNDEQQTGQGGGGGGGGAGFDGGSGGSGGAGSASVPAPGQPGSSGTSSAGGGGGAGGGAAPAPQRAGPGGTGGGRGASGSSGGAAGGSPGGSGGGSGAYISGLPFVTWPATGTRQGPSS